MSPRRMQAAVLYGKEDVRVEEVDVPKLGPGEVLVRTRVALTCGTDVKVYRRGYHARMIVPPALFGHEMAGVVEEVGEGAEEWTPGTPVVAANSAPCGECEFCRLGRSNLCDDILFWNGAYAEFVRIPARVARINLLRLPDGLSFRKAALMEPLACAVRGVEAAHVVRGQRVAILGAGPLGLMLLALSHLRGGSVVAVDLRSERLRTAREMGADEIVEVKPEMDLAAVLRRLSPGGRGFEVVLEAAGLPTTSKVAIDVVRKGGIVNLFAGCPAGRQIGVDPARLHYEELTITSTFHHTPASVREALSLIAGGQIDADRFLTAESPLERLPQVFARQAAGGEGLKTVVLPGVRE